MNQIWKIVGTAIITVVIVGGGVYYWQNSKTSSEISTIDKSSSDVIVNEDTYKTKNWETHTSVGVSIKYPNDGTYTVEEDLDYGVFTIKQEKPGNKFNIGRTDSPPSYPSTYTKIFNKNTFKGYQMGIGYGYFIENNDQFYIFESVWPENEVFELMMSTVEFE